MNPTFPLYDNLHPIPFKEMPFEVKRMFIVQSASPGEVRGNHAHWNTSQMLVCSAGIIQLDTETMEGAKKRMYLEPGESYYHGPLEWLTVTYITGRDILLSFCSAEYSECDYIRNYEQFKNIQHRQRK